MTIEIENWDNVVDKTVFLLLSFKRFGNSKKAFVKMDDTKADTTRFNHTKKLLESPELASITKSDNAIRLLVDSFCIPYAEGVRLAPWKNVPKITGILREYKTVTRPALVEAFLDVYEDQVNAAKLALGPNHFNPLDYPTKAQVAKEFEFVYQFKSFSTPEKLQAIDPLYFEEEQEKAAELYRSAVQDFTTNLRATAFEMVDEFLNKLSDNEDGKKKRLRPERLQAIKDFVAGFDALNVAGDQGLAAELSKLHALIDGVDVEKLRENEGFKLEFAAKMAEVKAGLGTLVEVKGRKFRD